MAVVAVTTDAELLARHAPRLRYDSQGSFAADSPAIVTDRRANLLKGADGAVISKPAAGGSGLALHFLASRTYGDRSRVRKTDYLDEVGKDYVAQARSMHTPEYRDRIYGHAVAVDDERWLQYWFFYYYNDKAFLGFGLHEGDWEMVQVRINSAGEPAEMTFAQHTHGQRCSWSAVETNGPRPIVYVARGSQASYPAAGNHDAPIVKDRADGLGADVSPELEVIADRTPAWVGWPGRWGSTRARNRLESDSPPGPAFHGQWKDPVAFHEDARVVDPAKSALVSVPPPPAPSIRAERDHEHAVVEYGFKRQPHEPLPTTLIVSVDGRGDGLPPATKAFPIEDSSGEVEHPLVLAPDTSYVVRASAADSNGVSSKAVEFQLRRSRKRR